MITGTGFAKHSFANCEYVCFQRDAVDTHQPEVSLPVIIAPLVLYEVARAYHKKHGLDIGLAFKEIPLE